MVIEIKRENGLRFAVDSSDIKEVGEHQTGGTYVILADGSSLLLEQDYEAFRELLGSSVRRFDFEFVQSDFTLMSKQKYKQLTRRQKVKKGKQKHNNS